MTPSDPPPPSRRGPPDTYLILAVAALVLFAATYLIPHGVFDVAATDGGRERIVPGSYAAVEGVGGAPLFGTGERVGLANLLFEGLATGDRTSATVGLAALLLILGGAFGMILRTGAIDRALHALLPEAGAGREPLLAALFVAFSLGGAVFGMSEEAIVFTFIVVPALVRAGYDSLTGVTCVFVATQIGFATSWMNPFNVLIAQGIADLPALSGLGFRAVMWAAFTALGAAAVWRYGRFVRRNPERSLSYASDAVFRDAGDAADAQVPFGRADALILAILTAGIAWVGWGVATQGYYLAEIAAQFFVIGTASAVVARLFRLEGVDGDALMEAFRDGSARMVPAVLVVAAAKGMVLMLGGDDPAAPSVLNTALHGAGGLTQALPSWASAWGMLVVQSSINVVVVSGSGQAALTMPLMAPLADIAGVTRQTAVLAFQLGDGLTNIIVPASASLLGCLGAARLDWVTWARFIWRPLAYALALASGVVLFAQAIGYA